MRVGDLVGINDGKQNEYSGRVFMQTLNPLIAGSFNGVARGRRRGLEGKPEADKVENVKVERIDNQDVLRVASPRDTIRIFLSDDNRSTIENLMQSKVGTGITIKDIEGVDVRLLRVTMNMKPGIYFSDKKKKSISVFDEELKLLLNKND